MDSKKGKTEQATIRRHPVLIELPDSYIKKLDERAAAENRKRKAMAEVIVMQQLDATPGAS